MCEDAASCLQPEVNANSHFFAQLVVKNQHFHIMVLQRCCLLNSMQMGRKFDDSQEMKGNFDSWILCHSHSNTHGEKSGWGQR